LIISIIENFSQQLTIYDDFAHHPTAIKTTLDGLRAKVGDAQNHRKWLTAG
jgi:UDP-N-acetylmuramate-alanine ligase